MIENIINKLNDEEIKKVLPIFIKYCDLLYARDYYKLYKEILEILNSERE